MIAAKAIVYRQNKEINTYTYYDFAKVFSEWKNINTKTYYQTANSYQKYLDTFGNKYNSPQQYGVYFSGEAYSKVKLLYKYSIGNSSTFVKRIAPTTKSEKICSTNTDVITSYL